MPVFLYCKGIYVVNLDNAAMWATAVSGYLFIILTLLAAARWVFRHYLENLFAELKEAVLPIQELKPNGGSSLNDKINKQIIPMLNTLVEKQQTIAVDVATLDGKFEQHIREHGN
jgi:dihydroxyacid dehydratase/phosphogluconate dehydratase